MLYTHHNYKVNEHGHLMIGEVDATLLAKKYETPLYIYDIERVRQNCRDFMDPFKEQQVKGRVAYASKAFSSIGILQVIQQEGLSVDVVSKGELYTAIKAGFDPERIHLHGNNKSESELEMAIKTGVGCIVIDNFYEIELLDKLLSQFKKKVNALIRVTPGIESDTHHYIMTGNEDSKFGFNLQNGQAKAAFLKLQHHPYINLKGVHCHIGSQIFETEGFILATNRLFNELSKWHKMYQYEPEVINLGGGFGIQYTKEDQPLHRSQYVNALIKAVEDQANKIQIPMPEIWIEPGRSIVGDAGITLYTIGSIKNIPHIRKYISVDGGMTDNLRPALYGAKYEAILANKANSPASQKISVAGKCCESGDMLIWDLSLPHVESGDLLAVFSTGAYGYSMASHYNRFSKPAVVFVENGRHRLVIKRETYQDVVRNDLPYIG
ncbi:diaminopimelate decarboxylase [Cerasibacillus quisquiliarum]|uniref:Diaminopimelate decarboxylase n=1 Tax=Cerasibacillus quisquiliarum TaxID=227865 RepID=A0A511UYZ0_9BACI|nr:diaminopimelate decarboxylase [Cerasibacillus quisquiliarum]MBB5145420.1 diaminopimelate decarboxylase [Cerasibacillus quisquiliarum]GEN31854.1 diaminopimelate decarboxylase [Cerasibacillus quisquiliarum]